MNVNELVTDYIKSEKNRSILDKALRAAYPSQDEYVSASYQVAWRARQGAKSAELLALIKNSALEWKAPEFRDCRLREAEQDNFIENPFEVVEGVLECKCGSKRVFSYQMQTRGLDEPQTTFAQCVKCGTKWTYSG